MSKRIVSEEFKSQCVESYHRRGKRSAESVAAELDIGKTTLVYTYERTVREAKDSRFSRKITSAILADVSTFEPVTQMHGTPDAITCEGFDSREEKSYSSSKLGRKVAVPIGTPGNSAASRLEIPLTCKD